MRLFSPFADCHPVPPTICMIPPGIFSRSSPIPVRGRLSRLPRDPPVQGPDSSHEKIGGEALEKCGSHEIVVKPPRALAKRARVEFRSMPRKKNRPETRTTCGRLWRTLLAGYESFHSFRLTGATQMSGGLKPAPD